MLLQRRKSVLEFNLCRAQMRVRGLCAAPTLIVVESKHAFGICYEAEGITISTLSQNFGAVNF